MESVEGAVGGVDVPALAGKAFSLPPFAAHFVGASGHHHLRREPDTGYGAGDLPVDDHFDGRRRAETTQTELPLPFPFFSPRALRQRLIWDHGDLLVAPGVDGAGGTDDAGGA